MGNKTDIAERQSLISKNIYGNNFEYNAVNPNAISDGDEKGRGENNNSVGTKTDINERIGLQSKNKYGQGKTYPDF